MNLVRADHPVLRSRAGYVPSLVEAKQAALRMVAVMRAGGIGPKGKVVRGVGLAAPQVGLAWRLFVAEEFGAGEPRMFLDPVLHSTRGKLKPELEGCLSLPGLRVWVERPAVVLLEYTNFAGERRTDEFDGLLARVIQHEMDHLEGIMIDRYEVARAGGAS